MTRNPANPKVEAFLTRTKTWRKEFEKLRSILLGCGLSEDLKWGVPCYMFEKKNIVLIHGFKEYCAILFFKGALLKDPDKALITQTKNTQASRQIRFSSVAEISRLKSTIQAYVREAIQLEKEGKKIEYKKTTEYPVPAEFKKQLKSRPGLKAAFDSLTPGRQRAYLLYFSQAKQSVTRESRIRKYTGHILKGKGMDD